MNRILLFDLIIVADKIGARGTRNDMHKSVGISGKKAILTGHF